MNETTHLIGSFLAGAALGAVFFGGLWWTIRRGLCSSRVARWLLASQLLRTGIVLMGFHFVAQGNWQRLLMCLGGFVAARLVFLRLTCNRGDVRVGSSKEVGHAP